MLRRLSVKFMRGEIVQNANRLTHLTNVRGLLGVIFDFLLVDNRDILIILNDHTLYSTNRAAFQSTGLLHLLGFFDNNFLRLLVLRFARKKLRL